MTEYLHCNDAEPQNLDFLEVLAIVEDGETLVVPALVVLVATLAGLAVLAFEEAGVSVVSVDVEVFVDVVASVAAEVAAGAVGMEYHCGIGWRPRNTLHLVLAPVPEMAFAMSLLQQWLTNFLLHQRASELEGV